MKKFLLTIIIFLFLITPIYVSAGIIPPCKDEFKVGEKVVQAAGDCGICDALWVVSGLSRWILGIVGTAALLFFIIGGFMWITSAGSSEKIKKGQTLMAQTIIGILIVVFAWFGINFVINSLADIKEPGKYLYLQPIDTEWYNICAGKECEGKSECMPCDNLNGYCKNGKCEPGSACACLAKFNENYKDWDCHTPEACGLQNYNQCDTAPNCEKNLCPGGAESVCCKIK